MLSQDTVRIPLRARDGSVRAYAIVDAADADWVNQWRWSLNEGYAARCEYIGRKVRHVYLHRELLGLARGDGLKGDHRDRDKLNCRRSNLRVSTHRGNMQNTSSRMGTSSRYRGVHWSKAHQRWQAQVGVDGKSTYLGLFDSEEEAANAAKAARLKLLPFAID